MDVSSFASTTAISAVHPDIIQTHILNKLDGQTLASAACASPMMHTLCTQDKLWAEICNATWPSTNHDLVSDVISTFSAGHRSFFSDSFSAVDQIRPSKQSQPLPSQLISAVDIHYKNKLVYSKVESTETDTDWFLSAPFRVDLLDPKETVSTPVKFEGDNGTYLTHLQNHMTLTWVVIDPTRKRAVDLSSLRPVSVHRHWLTGDLQVQYATVMGGGVRVGSSEFIQTNIVVTCGGKEGGALHVREVSLLVQDMDGKSLSGKESLVILQEAMGSERRKRGKMGEEKERYKKYLEIKRERKERILRRERRMDMVCIAAGLTIFIAFWTFILLR